MKKTTRKALPKKEKKDEPKKAKQGGASQKKTGKGSKPRYSYPQEAFGKKKEPAPMEAPEQAGQGDIPPPPPRVPEPLPVDPRKLAAQLGLSVDTLADAASRFADKKIPGGKDGFVRFMCAKLREMNEKHGLDQSYYDRAYEALLQLSP